MHRELKKLHYYLKSNGLDTEAASLRVLSADFQYSEGAFCDKVISEGPDHWMTNCTRFGTTDNLSNTYTYTLWSGPAKDDGPKRFGSSVWIAAEAPIGSQQTAKKSAWSTLETKRGELERERWDEVQRERSSAGSQYDDVITDEDIGSDWDGRNYGGGMATAPSHLTETNPGTVGKVDRILSSPGAEAEGVTYSEPELESNDGWVGIMSEYFDKNEYTSMERRLPSSELKDGARSFTVHNRSMHNRHQPEIKISMSKTSPNTDPLLETFDVEVAKETPEYSEYRRMSKRERGAGNVSGKNIKRWSDGVATALNMSLGGRGMTVLEWLTNHLPRRVNPIDKYIVDSDEQKPNSDYDPELVREIRWDKFHRFLSKLAPKGSGPHA